MNKIIITIALLFSILNSSSVEVYKNSGTTYKINESNIIQLFKEHVEANKESIQKRVQEEREKMKNRIEDYKPKELTINLPTATKENVFYPLIDYELKDDIKDSYGKVLYKKGFVFNPLHYISLNEKYIFIDYTDKKQREWIKKQEINKDITAKIIITNGRVFDAIKEFEREVFYANDILIDKFKLEAVLLIVEQEQDRIKVKQFKLKD